MEETLDERWIGIARLQKIFGRKQLIEKGRAIIRLDQKDALVRRALSKGLHRLVGSLIPVSIEQVRLLLAAKLNDSILPGSMKCEAKRLECKLGWLSAGPGRHGAQKRMIDHGPSIEAL